MSKYTSHPASWNAVEILSEDKAIALLMCLEPEAWLRYFIFCENNSGKDLAKLSANDRAEMLFVEEYESFLRKAFNFIPEISRYAVLRGWVSSMKQRGQWNGSLAVYAQTLYDNGFIFTPEIVARLQLKYSPDSQAIQFYKDWHDKKAWTLAEAIDLFAGKDPREKSPSFVNLCQYDDLKYGDLSDLVERHIAIKKLTRLNDNKSFEPESIVAWLIENTQYTPPPSLLEVLYPPEKKKAGPISSAALEKAYRAYVEGARHLTSFPSWQNDQKVMTEALGAKPTDLQIKEIRRRLAPNAWKQQGRRKSV